MHGPSKCAITIFLGATNLYKKINNSQQQFLENLVLYICKGCGALSSCEIVWLWRLVLQKCSHVIFPFHSHVVEEVLPKMVQKTMNLHVFPNFKSTTTMFVSFDL
jgi:hypothetical protein